MITVTAIIIYKKIMDSLYPGKSLRTLRSQAVQDTVYNLILQENSRKATLAH